ncbi:hypothetical protein N0V84_005944 [Fusarium piperis]|uniref:Rhodopsin domain-containing protein n=1 Tax=Fusarium piperis TaxID=1435070 RepID=A0A9W8WCQ1_9HYPO|nr:hypothetical protein N0V84_005944 [Fusarium piperis]
MGLRLLSRRLKKIPLSWDDYFAICCYDITDRPIAEILYQSKLLLFIAELFYAAALFFAKLSILSLYWRMFQVTNIRLPIQILFACSAVWMTFRLFMGIFHCVPVHAFWDSSAGGYCAIEDKKFFFGTTLIHAVIDIAILILPMVEIGKLQLPLLQKIGIMLMFTFGFFICGAAIVVIVAARQFNDKSPDLTWNICTIVVWATVEVNLVNVSGSNSYANNYSRSQTKQSIRLDTIHKPKANDESSSTHQLADSDSDRRRSVSDFENHVLGRFSNSISTVTGSRDLGASQSDLDATFGGIVVKNETMVQISQRG